MAYRVILTQQAEADADRATTYIRQFAPEAAARWFAGLTRAVLSLNEMPERCPLAPESRQLSADLRQLLYGKRQGVYRILFVIRADIVKVVAIRHGARQWASPEEIAEALAEDGQ